MNSDERWDNVNVLTNSDIDLEIKNNAHDGSGSTNFDIKSYIPKRSTEKYLKPIYIAGSAIFIVLVIIVIVVLSMKKSNSEEDSKSSNLLPSGLIVHNNDGFWTYNAKTKKSSLLFQVKSSVNTFDVVSRKMLIYSETDSSKVASLSNDKSTNSTYHNLTSILEEAAIKPQGMAVDFITGNVYIVSEALELLIVVDAQAQNHNILLSDLRQPREVVLDPSQGLMFICQFSDSILRGNMDGTSLAKIVRDSETEAITLDRKSRRIYWVQNSMNIESSDYDGNDRRLVFADNVGIASLAILGGEHLFWLWPNYGRVQATLWSCRLKNESCEEHVMHEHESFHNARHIKPSLEPGDEDAPSLCRANNGGCQHLCLTARDGSRSCACKLGWQLNPDRRTCRPIVDFVLYVLDGWVRGRVIADGAKLALTDVFWPSPYSVESVKTKGTVDFDYDPGNDDFYFSDDVQIYRMKLRAANRGKQSTLFLQKELFYTIEDIAYDWLTGNMYYSHRSKLHSRRHYLMMFNVNRGTEYKKVIANFIYDGIFGLQACPYALAVYPSKGYLFFTAGEDSQRSIQRLSMNGTKLSQIFQVPYVHEHRLIGLDYDKDKIYWIFHIDDSGTKIKYADFNGENEKVIVVDAMRNAKTISVYNQWLYISNDTSIYKCHKETGNDLTRIVPAMAGLDSEADDAGGRSRKIIGVKLISSAVQAAGLADNPCAVDNGGCERFCFAAPQKYCD